MKYISREDAREGGEVRFFDGTPCGKGHIDERYVSDGRCIECYREAARRRRANKPEYYRKQDRDFYQKHKERRLFLHNKYVNENRGKVREANNRHRKNNLEKRRWAVKDAYKKNPKLWAHYSKLRKRIIKERTPKWSPISEIKDIYLNCPPGHHVDHIYPLRGKLVSGLHVPWNLQYLSAEENLIKKNKMPILEEGVQYA